MHWNLQAICHGLWNTYSGSLPVPAVAEWMFIDGPKFLCKPYKMPFHCCMGMVVPLISAVATSLQPHQPVPTPLPNPTGTWAVLGRIYQNCTNTSWLLTLFSLIWWFPSRAPCSKQTWMVVISEAAHALCDLASSLELCFATRNYIRKPHMFSDVMQYLWRVIIVWRSQIQNWWVSIAGEAKPCSELHPCTANKLSCLQITFIMVPLLSKS